MDFRILHKSFDVPFYFRKMSLYDFRSLKIGRKRNFEIMELWNLITDMIKSEPNLELFKKKISKWKGESCLCGIY